MARERTLLLAGGIVGVLVVAALLLAPRVSEELAPEPRRAFVAIQPAGSSVARAGRVELPAGTGFTLHAVLEAVDRDGQPVYYTAAPGLEIAGEAVPAAALRRWDRREEAKVLWFTVEGEKPFLPVTEPADLSRVTFGELFRPDWPQTWSVPGVLEPRHDDHIRRVVDQKSRTFGTQRYHARIELFDPNGGSLPQRRFKSPGAAELRRSGGGRGNEAGLATVVATLPGVAAPASAVFGLTQLELPPGASSELLAAAAKLASDGLAFSVSTVLRDTLRAAGSDAGEAAAWRPVTIGGGLRWGADARAGDLLRSGGDIAVLHRDGGAPGVVDGGDLVLAFDRGAAVLPLSAVFTGLPVEWAPLARR